MTGLTVQGYDIIGDVHGCATQLEALLAELGYQKASGTSEYCHPDRHAIFGGDLIDRGTEQLRVLQIAKDMVEAGSAQIVDQTYVYPAGIPVFYGHYWRQGSPKHLHDWTDCTACVDFSAVKGGTLTAYRWSGEERINPANYVPLAS